MSLWPYLLFLLRFILFTSSNGAFVNNAMNKFFTSKTQQSNSPYCYSQKSRSENGATILEMQHKDYCSGSISDMNRKLQKQLVAEDIRVQSIQASIKNIISGKVGTLSQTQIPIISGVKLHSLNYIVTVTLGGRKATVIVDTGSDLTWVQCQPCRQCYNQPEPLFNPSVCPTYHSIPCNSSAWCDEKECNYVVSFGDGSYTIGEIGQDHLVLGSTSVENFVFGCGRNNKGLFVFGGDSDTSIFKNSTPISYNRMLANPQLLSFYFLNLSELTIGGVAIQDSAFGKVVKAELLKQFSGYPLKPGVSILDTCFDHSAYEEVNISTVKMQFEVGAEMEVDVTGVLYIAKSDASQVCLALASLQYDDEIGIVRNYQQKNTRVINNIKQSQVGFAERDM
ncbi:unnamed protein product [Withania somnifera]